MTAQERPATSADDALALAQRAGIHRIAVPTPFLVGRVNCYLIEDEPLTLIDTGPNSGKSLDDLERALGTLGRRIEDLELIVVTHQHMDHVGLLEILARRSGAQVASLDLLAPYLAAFSHSAAADDEFAQGVTRRHGVPDDLATVLGSLAAAFRAFGSSGNVTRELHPGGSLELRDRTLRIFHRPGHGDPIVEHVELIDERLRMHRRRAARVLQILDARPLSAYEIAVQMWGNVAVTQAYLTLSEVLGHLDLLVEMGQATEHDRDGTSLFEALSS